MKNLTTVEKEQIKAVADEHFDGDIKLASAAHVHGLGVVQRVGAQLADWFDHDAIESTAAQIEKPSAPAKKSTPKRKTKTTARNGAAKK